MNGQIMDSGVITGRMGHFVSNGVKIDNGAINGELGQLMW